MTELIAIRYGYGGPSPVIKGTRIRVSDIVRYYRLYEEEMGTLAPGSDDYAAVENIQEALPHLSSVQIKAALDYWRCHEDEIEEEIALEEELLRKFATS